MSLQWHTGHTPVLFWYFRISRSATVPGRNRFFCWRGIGSPAAPIEQGVSKSAAARPIFPQHGRWQHTSTTASTTALQRVTSTDLRLERAGTFPFLLAALPPDVSVTFVRAMPADQQGLRPQRARPLGGATVECGGPRSDLRTAGHATSPAALARGRRGTSRYYRRRPAMCASTRRHRQAAGPRPALGARNLDRRQTVIGRRRGAHA